MSYTGASPNPDPTTWMSTKFSFYNTIIYFFNSSEQYIKFLSPREQNFSNSDLSVVGIVNFNGGGG